MTMMTVLTMILIYPNFRDGVSQKDRHHRHHRHSERLREASMGEVLPQGNPPKSLRGQPRTPARLLAHEKANSQNQRLYRVSYLLT